MYSLVSRSFIGILGFIFLIIIIYFIVEFWRNRSQSIINARFPVFTLVFIGALCNWFIVQTVFACIGECQCECIFYSYHIALPLILSTFCVRIFILFARIHLSKEKFDRKLGFFSNRPYLTSYTFLFLLLFLFFIIQIPFFLLSFFYSSECPSTLTLSSSGGFILFVMTICVIIFFIFREEHEQFALKQEVMYLACAWLTYSVFWALVVSIPTLNEIDKSTFPLLALFQGIVVVTCSFISLTFPVRILYLQLNSNFSFMPFKEFLNYSEKAVNIFKNFLYQEFCVENLYFLQALDVLISNYLDMVEEADEMAELSSDESDVEEESDIEPNNSEEAVLLLPSNLPSSESPPQKKPPSLSITISAPDTLPNTIDKHETESSQLEVEKSVVISVSPPPVEEKEEDKQQKSVSISLPGADSNHLRNLPVTFSLESLYGKPKRSNRSRASSRRSSTVSGQRSRVSSIIGLNLDEERSLPVYERFLSLYNKYLAPGAILQVNVSNILTKKYFKLVSDVSLPREDEVAFARIVLDSDILEQLFDTTVALLEAGPYMRFAATTAYADLMKGDKAWSLANIGAALSSRVFGAKPPQLPSQTSRPSIIGNSLSPAAKKTLQQRSKSSGSLLTIENN